MESPRLPVTVLLIEDDIPLRTLLCEWLRAWAGPTMRCVEASTLQDGLAAVAGGGIDIVLLDWRIPGGDGPRSIEALVDAMPAREAPAVIDTISGAITTEEGLAAIRAGADDYLQKRPGSMREEFVFMVQRSWERHQMATRLVEKLKRSAHGDGRS